MKNTNPGIGYRAYSEALRLFQTAKEAARLIGCGKNVVYSWMNGTSPSAMHLARLYFLGADVIWILTGKKNKEG